MYVLLKLFNVFVSNLDTKTLNRCWNIKENNGEIVGEKDGKIDGKIDKIIGVMTTEIGATTTEIGVTTTEIGVTTAESWSNDGGKLE